MLVPIHRTINLPVVLVGRRIGKIEGRLLRGVKRKMKKTKEKENGISHSSHHFSDSFRTVIGGADLAAALATLGLMAVETNLRIPPPASSGKTDLASLVCPANLYFETRPRVPLNARGG